MDMTVLRELRERTLREIDEGNLPSAQFALARDGDVVVHETLGDAPAEARFNMFSSTKPLVATVMWQLVAEGLLTLEAPVVSVWPDFAAHGKHMITLEHLLVHSAGIPSQAIDLSRVDDRSARVSAMETWALEWEPGTRYEYHGLSAYWVMEELVELVTGDPLQVALRWRVLDPLGLDRLELGVPRLRQQDIQPIVAAGIPATPAEVKEIVGVEMELPVDDTFLRSLEDPDVREAGVPGAGGVSDAASVALLYQALLHDTSGLWDPAILKDATTNPRNKLRNAMGVQAWRSIGLEFVGEGRGARFRVGNGEPHPSAFGHGGASGQIAWADPTTGVSFAFYTNGVDRNAAREWHRSRDINALAARAFG